MNDNNVNFKITAEYDANEAGAKKAAEKGAEAYNKAYKEAQLKFREQQINPQAGRFADLGNKINDKFRSVKDPFKKLKAKREREEREITQVDPIIATNRDIQSKGFREAAAFMDSDYAKSKASKNSFGSNIIGRMREDLQPALDTLKAVSATFEKIESSVKNTNIELAKTRETVESIKGSQIKDLFFRGTDYAALNNSIRAQKAIVDKLKPTESDYSLAAMAMNRGKWTTEGKQRVKDARERIKMYEQELAVLKRLEKNEQAPTGGLFSKRFSNLMSKRLGILSSKNSIFDKKTIAGNGILQTAGYSVLRGMEIGVSRLIKPLKKVRGLWDRFTRRFVSRIITNTIKAIIRLAKEGLKNLNAYSEHLGTPFHQNVQRLAASLNFLKNAFAAMVGPIVNAVTPALEKLMDTFAMLANNIGAFFAALTGQSQFSAALKKTVTETKTAAGKLKDILAFDELNRLSGETGSDNSADEMFEEWGEGTIFERIRQAFLQGEWEQLGKEFAEKINALFDNLKAKNIGKNLGKKIGEVIKFARSFLENLDFSSMGETLATWFNNMIEGIDWQDVGRLIFRLFSGALDFFAGLIRNLNWGKIASAIGGFFTGVFNGATEWIKKIDWTNIGSELVANIVDFIKNLKIGDVIVAAYELLKAIIKGAIQLVIGALGELLDLLIPGFSDWFEDLKSKILGWMPDWMKDFLGINDTKKSIEISGKVNYELGERPANDLSLIRQKVTGRLDTNPTLGGLPSKFDNFYSVFSARGGWLRAGQTVSVTYGSVTVSGGRYDDGSFRAASGGTFDKGQLFIANEAGPELVGNLGGKSTVTNQDQFTQGLIDANSYVVDAVLQVVKAVNNKNFDVYMDAQKVGKSVTNYQNNAARRYGV